MGFFETEGTELLGLMKIFREEQSNYLTSWYTKFGKDEEADLHQVLTENIKCRAGGMRELPWWGRQAGHFMV